MLRIVAQPRNGEPNVVFEMFGKENSRLLVESGVNQLCICTAKVLNNLTTAQKRLKTLR